MALVWRARTVFVGTAKSVSVAPYGRDRRTTAARARACFVRDEATAQSAARARLDGRRSANAIVDLFATRTTRGRSAPWRDSHRRWRSFPEAVRARTTTQRFCSTSREALAADHPALGAVLSIARGLDADRFAADARRAGLGRAIDRRRRSIPFVLPRRRDIVRAWRGELGPLLQRVALVLGQAGTANEAAAAAGVPVVAFERDRDRKARLVSRRQRGLLGDALAVFPGD